MMEKSERTEAQTQVTAVSMRQGACKIRSPVYPIAPHQIMIRTQRERMELEDPLLS